MDGSKGSSPVSNSVGLMMRAEFSYFVWFLLGFLSYFGLKLVMVFSTVFIYSLHIPFEFESLFTKNLAALALISFVAGLSITHFFFPISRTCLELSMITSFVAIGVMFYSLLIEIPGNKILFVVCIMTVSYFFGAVQMIGVTSANDPYLPGKRKYRLGFFIAAQPLGHIILMMTNIIMEIRVISFLNGYDNAVEVIYIVFAELIVLFCIVIISIYIFSLVGKTNTKSYLLHPQGFIQSRVYYLEAFRLLGKTLNYVFMLVMLQSGEGFFNSLAFLYSTFHYQHVQMVGVSFLIVFVFVCADLIGRFLALLINKLQSKKRERVRVLRQNSRETVYEADKRVEVLIDRSNEKLLGSVERDEEAYHEYPRESNTTFILAWLGVAVRLILGMMIIIKSHFPDSSLLFLFNYVDVILLVTSVCSLIRGSVLTHIYINIYKGTQESYLEEMNVSEEAEPNEPQLCTDMRHNAGLAGTFAVSIVALIDFLVYFVWVYLGFKYFNILNKAEHAFYEQEVWPTDRLEGQAEKMLWWLKGIVKSILSDLRHPLVVFSPFWSPQNTEADEVIMEMDPP